MNIVFDKTTGTVLRVQTISTRPEGLSREELEIVLSDHATSTGISDEQLGVLSFHDEEDFELVQKILISEVHVDVETNEISINGPKLVRGLSVDRDYIPADGKTPAVVTYTAGDSDTADFNVNGVDKAVAMTNGVAQLEIVASVPDTIRVICGDFEVTIIGEAI